MYFSIVWKSILSYSKWKSVEKFTGKKHACQNITSDFKPTSNNIWSDLVKNQDTMKRMWVYDTV